jgi:rubredoxin
MPSIFDKPAPKPKRKVPGKLEWEAIKKRCGNRCLMCGVSEKAAGGLDKAHLKSHSTGGSQFIPLCPTCHRKYDKGLCTTTELKAIGIDPEKYGRFKPKRKPQPKPRNIWL